MKTICFFDIDGTLLNSGGAGQHAMERALEQEFAVTGPYSEILAAGRTDRAITSDLFEFHNLESSEENWQRFLEAYLELLPEALTVMNGTVLPGVEPLLAELSQNDALALGLLTGNFEVGARLKLEHYDLAHHFKFGGYGDLHLDRDDVARLAHTSACQFLCDEIQAERVWVIGDTPSDVRCGRAIGARVIAVATGIYALEELQASNPDYLFEDLSDIAEILRILSNSG